MEYAIQERLFKGDHEERLISVLRRFGFPVFFFRHIPFTEDLIWIKKPEDSSSPYILGDAPSTTNVMGFGSVSFSHFAKNKGWNPGSFYNENHDYTVYSKYWKDNLLNWDSKIQKLTDDVELDFFFARPTGDTKLFKGELYGKDIWNVAVNHAIVNGADPNSLVQISSPKNILQEVRCFVVNKRVITASYYKIGNRIVYQKCNDDDILYFAQDMINEFNVAPGFVIDIGRTDNGLKVVEVNCLNCSGFYAIDEFKLVEALEINFSNRNL